MKITRLKLLTAVLGLAAYLATSSTYAQNVTFGAAQTITGDANLIDAADTADAINVDAILPNGNLNNGSPSPGSSLTLDGVIFNAATFTSTSTSDGKITLTANSGGFSQYGNNNGGYPVSGSASANFAAVMSAGGVFGSGPGVITISASALVTGDSYALQIFNFSNDGVDESTLFTSGSSSVTLFDNNGVGANPASYLGQFTTGFFTATGANETIDFANASGAYTPVVGAINLANITAVPEPSTYALMLGGMLLLVLQLRHRRQPSV
jgi:hypothetical protein